jgi:hypothetical protein
MHNSITRLMSARTLTFSAALLAIATPGFAVGCSSAPTGPGTGTVGGAAVAFNRSTHALTAGSLQTVDGNYGPGCSDHGPGDRWSVSFVGPGAPLLFAPLLVNSSDGATCQLAVTQLDAMGGTYTTPSPIPLGGVFGPTASLFIGPGAPPDELYANADITPDDFSTSVVIDVETSDNPTEVTPVTIKATTAVAIQSGTPSPDYAAVSTVGIAENAGTVTGQSGNVTLTFNVTPGESYDVVNFPTPPMLSFTFDDEFFNAPVPHFPISGNPFTIDAATLVPNGTPVPSSSVIFIQHVDSATQNKTYETVEYDFAASGP